MTSQNDDDPEYKVGYGKPPLKSQFRKGVSGNPRGRRPKLEPSRTRLQRQLDFLTIAEQPLTIAVNGKHKSVSAYQAVILKLRQKALSGDWRAMELYIEMHKELLDDFAQANPEATGAVEALYRARMNQRETLSAEDVKILNELNRKTRRE